MEIGKNTSIIHNVCLVQIKSADLVIDLPNLTTIYGTPSKITLTTSSSNKGSGVLHTKRLNLNYPGLGSLDFDKFHELTKGVFQIFVKLDNGDIYEVSSLEFPLECSTSFNKHHTLNFSGRSPIPIKYRGNQSGGDIVIDGFNYDFDFYLS